MADEDNKNQETNTPAQAGAPETSKLPPSIVRIKDAQDGVHEFDLAKLDEKQAAELYALLPEHRQKAAKELAPFFLNFKNAIKDIPEELKKPGAIEACMLQLQKQGGFMAEDTSKEVLAFLNGPYCADLRRSGLYKGVKSTKEVADLAAGVMKTGTESILAYMSALGLPFRLINAGIDKTLEAAGTAAKLTESQAMALATAYQGAMYMATDSETAPAATKSRDPNWADHIQTGAQFGWQYVAVVGMAIWNMVTHYDSKKDFAENWQTAWAEAKTKQTGGKDFFSYDDKLKANAVERTEGKARPEIQAMLKGVGTVAGVNAAPYMDALQNDTYYVGYDSKVYRTIGGKPEAQPVAAPDGNPLTQGMRNAFVGEQVRGGLFDDIGVNANTAGSALGVAGAAATYKGVAQGAAHTVVTESTLVADKRLAKAEEKLKGLEARADRALKGEKSHFWSRKPESLEKLEEAINKAEAEVAALKATRAALPQDPIQHAKEAGNAAQRLMGRMAEEATKELPANAGKVARIAHSFVEVGQWAGSLVGRAGMLTAVAVKNTGTFLLKDVPMGVFEKVKGFATGVVHGTAASLTPTNTNGKPGNLAMGLADVANQTEKEAGLIGKLVGKAGTLVLKGASVINPVMNLAHANGENDKAGMAIYGAETAGVVAALKILGRKAIPGLNAGLSSVDFADGYRKGDGAKMVKAGTELGTMGAGGAIGGLLGLLGGPFAPATVPAGIAIGASIGGWLGIGTGIAAERAYMKHHDVTAQAEQPAPTGALPANAAVSAAVLEQHARTAAAQAKAQASAQPAAQKLGFAGASCATSTSLCAVLPPGSGGGSAAYAGTRAGAAQPMPVG